MKAISIQQPWASLIVSGRKTIEIRSWKLNHRGPLVILAGTGKWKGEHEHQIGPRGVIVGVVDVVDCREFSRADSAASCVPESELRRLTFDQSGPLGPKQWFSWVFKNARTCRNVPFKGRLGIIDLEPATLLAAGISV
jgi:hypothetical protein